MDSLPIYILVLAVTGLFIFSISDAFRRRDKAFLRSVAVVVLGDIGRSPRMMYHAESFATARFQTYVVGYGGEYLKDEVTEMVLDLMLCYRFMSYSFSRAFKCAISSSE